MSADYTQLLFTNDNRMCSWRQEDEEEKKGAIDEIELFVTFAGGMEAMRDLFYAVTQECGRFKGGSSPNPLVQLLEQVERRSYENTILAGNGNDYKKFCVELYRMLQLGTTGLWKVLTKDCKIKVPLNL